VCGHSYIITIGGNRIEEARGVAIFFITDEILREFGDWRNISDLMKAGKIAVKRLNEYLVGGITFNQETTLCGKSIIKTIEKAKILGYFVELH